jgi:hypothetical protein
MKALHAEATVRGLSHDELSGLCRKRFGVASMREMNAGQMQELYFEWTGHALRRKRETELPRRGYAKRGGPAEMVSGEDLATLGAAFALRNWGPETQRRFIARQLNGREEIRTRKDFHRVFSGVRAMNRRDGLI